MGTRVVAALAIIGGAAFMVATVMWVERPMDLAGPVGYWAVFASFIAFAALAIAIWGLVSLFNERIGRPIALVGAVGGLGSAMAALGALGAFLLLPIGSMAVALDLARHGAMGWTLTIAHTVTAFACVALVSVAIFTGSPIASPLVYLILPYGLSWIGIGVALVRGQSVIDQPASSGSAA